MMLLIVSLYIFVYMVMIFGIINLLRLTLLAIGSHIYDVRKRKSRAFVLPIYTVVIPAYNEERSIIRCLESVTAANYDKLKLQIIVADDGSKDSTSELVRTYKQQHPHANILLLSRPNAGKAHALNYAIQNHARGELVMCLDADSLIHKDALVNSARHFLDPRVVALSSNVKIIPSGTILNLTQVYEYLISYQIKRALTTFNIEYIIGGIGSVFRRSALEAVGYYDTDTITEDIDLTMKLLRLGNKKHRVIYGADVISYTESVLTVRDLFKQRFRWKYGRLQTFLKNLDYFFSRDRRHAPQLTWMYLPFIIFSEIMFFLEPLMILFFIALCLLFADLVTLASACAIISSFIVFSILAEDTIPWKQKLKLVVGAPAMYLSFYIINVVEYIALVRTYYNVPNVRRSIQANACRWEHVARM